MADYDPTGLTDPRWRLPDPRAGWLRLVLGVLLVPAALVALLVFTYAFRGSDQPERDREALIALYEATDGDNWRVNTNWLSDKEIRFWYGVRTNYTPNVWRLLLGNNGLSGQIPAELGTLESLKVLDLSRNELSGPIPAELRDLRLLRYADLSHNNLSGPIKPFAGLDYLEELHLDHNDLSGPIPAGFWHLNLTHLTLEQNGLSGCIPDRLRHVGYSDLPWLDLPYCGVSGPPVPIPPNSDRAVLVAFYEATGGPNWKDSTNWLTDAPLVRWRGIRTDSEGSVTEIILYNNLLTGSIPAELGDLAELQSLNLRVNGLTGPIPPALSSLPDLELLYLKGNQLSGCIPWGLRLTATNDLAELGLRYC